MMAKMFYTLEEAQAALSKSEEEIKQYAREGRLREFRDGPRLMFKADQVEQLKGDLSSGGDHVDLGTSDSGGLIGLVDTTGASGTSITLSDADTGQSSQVGMKTKDDTALAADLGLSGSLGGVPSPGRPASSGTGLSGTATSRQGGINVFGDEVERVDPAAQTAITGAVREQRDLEGVGSGSGLLDLTRESDDTSLGAVLDEIAPSGGRLSPSDAAEGTLEMEETRAPARHGLGACLCPGARSFCPGIRSRGPGGSVRDALRHLRAHVGALRYLAASCLVFRHSQKPFDAGPVWHRNLHFLLRVRFDYWEVPREIGPAAYTLAYARLWKYR